MSRNVFEKKKREPYIHLRSCLEHIIIFFLILVKYKKTEMRLLEEILQFPV